MRRLLAAMAGFVILGLVNWSIYSKEQHLAHGEVVFPELAPVDPRSLMQGDYMTLRFAVGNDIQRAWREAYPSDGKTHLVASDGHAIIALDEHRVASFARLDDGASLAENERRIHFRIRNARTKFATNAFFFQEGHGEAYEAARYGKFRLNAKGEPLLTALYDGKLRVIGP